jgi:hypothetical protein
MIIKPHKADDFVVFIFDIKNGVEEIRIEIESFLEQECGLKLNVDSIFTIHLSSKWFHSLGARCQKALKIERSFYTYD